jgi:hypothetical protein
MNHPMMAGDRRREEENRSIAKQVRHVLPSYFVGEVRALLK